MRDRDSHAQYLLTNIRLPVRRREKECRLHNANVLPEAAAARRVAPADIGSAR